MKVKKFQKFSRKELEYSTWNLNKDYSLFYLNFDELKDMPGNFEKIIY